MPDNAFNEEWERLLDLHQGGRLFNIPNPGPIRRGAQINPAAEINLQPNVINNAPGWGNEALPNDWRMRPPVELRDVLEAGEVFDPEKEMRASRSEPEYWQKLLDAVKEIYECDAIVAGGAVRDYFLGCDPLDIDIFVNYNGEDNYAKATELGWGKISKVEAKGHRGPYMNEPEDEEPVINGVLEAWPRTAPCKVQLIFKPLPNFDRRTVLQNFDFNICKSSFDGELYDTEVAERDRENKTYTFCRPDYNDEQKQKSVRRYEKFSRRHPGFKFVGLNKMEDLLKKKKEVQARRFYLDFGKKYVRP